MDKNVCAVEGLIGDICKRGDPHKIVVAATMIVTSVSFSQALRDKKGKVGNSFGFCEVR